METPHGDVPQETLERLRLEIDALRESRKRIVLDADAGRRAIERELHDGVQQHLVALAVRLQLAHEALENDPAATELLAQIARDVQEAIEEAARLAQRIHPPRLDSSSLRAALRSWAATAGIRAGIEVQLSPGHSPEAAQTAYFCCLEALEHVVTDAHVSITVRGDDESLSFEVATDGAAPARVGLAAQLTTVRDRVEALGGVVEVQPRPQGGTRVSGRIPRSLGS